MIGLLHRIYVETELRYRDGFLDGFLIGIWLMILLYVAVAIWSYFAGYTWFGLPSDMAARLCDQYPGRCP